MFSRGLDRLPAAVIDRRLQLGWVATEPGVSDVDRTRGGTGDLNQRSDESFVGQRWTVVEIAFQQLSLHINRLHDACE